MPEYLCSLPNPGTAGNPKPLLSDDAQLIARWIAAENRPGRGVYFCPNPLKPFARTHGKNATAAIAVVYVDVDFKDIVESADEVERLLGGLLLTPTWIVRSGHGFHVGWELKEAVAHDDPDYDGVCVLQESLIEYLAGDPQVRPWSLLRRPGTVNSKDEPHVACEVIRRGPVVDLSELREMVEIVAEQPLLTRRPPAKPNGHARDSEGFAARLGNITAGNERVDVAARLAAMRFKGSGDSAIHATQRDVSASELRNGCTVEFVVDELLAATKQAVASDKRCARWDWDKEKHAIEEMCFGFINKLHPELYTLLPDTLRAKWEQALADGRRPKVFPAKHIGWHVRTFDDAKDAAKDSHTNASESPSPNRAPGAAKRTLVLRPFVPFDPAALPPRSWLYARHYQRRTVSLTAGPGGMGKSSLVLVECVAMATARDLLGEQPAEKLRIWLHNGEDPLEEIHRRIAAICQHYRIPQEELRGQLWLTSGNEFPLRVAKGYSNLEIDAALVKQIASAIGENEIDVAAFDPLVTLHSVSEGDPGKMDAVVRLFAGIADEHDAAIELNHHVRKPAAGSDADHDLFDVRGVMAITDAVRAARVLNRMNKADAENAGVDEIARLSHFRVDKAKGNYSPAQAATWRRFVSIELPNSDSVGVVAPWDFPGQGTATPEKAAAEQRAEQVFLRLLGKFTAQGINVSVNVGPAYAPAKFAGEREATSAKVSKAALQAAMTRLLDTGRIRSESIGRPSRPWHRLVAVPQEGLQ